MKMLFKKTILFALVVALGMASLPLVGVSAMGTNDQPAPSQADGLDHRLERVWARQLRIYRRMGNVDQFVERVQKLIDTATANGKDASGVQSALDAFKEAVQTVKPIYDELGVIVNAHEGFDGTGQVTDPEKARETIQAVRAKFKEIHDAMNGTGKALRKAIKDFRDANPRPWKTSAS